MSAPENARADEPSPGRKEDESTIVRILDPLQRVMAHPLYWVEGSARFLRDRTVISALVVGAGLWLAFGARFGWVTPPEGLSREGLTVAGVVVILSSLWLLETIPVAATALLPMVLFPVLGILPAAQVANAYGNSTILLLMGSFFLARGVERWGVPNLLAERVFQWAGGSAEKLIFGLMGATAFLSAWISNTAATLIMVTVGMVAVRKAEEAEPDRAAEVNRFRLALLLGIAFAANLGGMATPIGSPPNIVLLALYQELVPNASPVSFVLWMLVGIPMVLITVPLVAVFLTRVGLRFARDLNIGKAEKEGVSSMAHLAPGGRRALGIFAFTALLWVFRSDVVFGGFTLPGWAGLLGLGSLVDDAAVAVFGATLMFLAPAGPFEAPPDAEAKDDVRRARVLHVIDNAFRHRVLGWDRASEIPWGLLVLFGGGLALAGAFETSGLSHWAAAQLGDLEGVPTWLVVAVVAFGMSMLTEVTSNTASTAVVLPVLAVASVSLGLPPLMLMWPAALAASAAFLMPIGTPPNAIAAGAGNISVAQMLRGGIGVKLIVVPVIAVAMYLWMPVVLGDLLR